MSDVGATAPRAQVTSASPRGAAAAPDHDPDRSSHLPDPTDGRIHVLGKPVSKLALGGFMVGGIAIGGGLGATFGTRGAAIGGAIGGLVGAGLSSFTDGPRVGTSQGTDTVFVKTGEETYNTTCTATHRTNVGDTDGDGYANYHTTTSTYPCVQVRDVGYHENRPASGDFNLGRHKGARAGYDSLVEATHAVDGRAVFVQRGERVHAYGIDQDGPENKEGVTAHHDGVLQVNEG